MSHNIIEINEQLPNVRFCIVCDKMIHRTNVRTHLISKRHNMQILLNDFSDHFDKESAASFLKKYSEICATDDVIKYIHIQRLLEE